MIFGYLTSTEAGDDLKEKKNSGIEWIGEIPVDWKTIKSKYCISISNGSDPKTEGSTPVYGSGAESFKTCGEYKIGPAVLLGRKGATLHIPHYVEGNYWNVDTAFDATPFCGNINLKFYYYCACVFDYVGYISQTTLPGMTQTNYKNMSIPFPQLEVQERIANFLDEKCSQIDSIITRQQEVLEKLKAYKLSVITEAVARGLNPDVRLKDSGVEWIGEIPEHWDILKLQAHTRMLTPMRDRPEKLDGDIPWVRIEDYDGKYISASKEGLGVSTETVKEMNLKIYPVGSILCTSSCDLGKCAIVARELVSNQRFINIIPDSNTNSDYLYYLMLSNAERLNHLSTGTIQANLSRKAFEHLMVQFPPISEQKAIAEYLDRKCEAVELSINKKQELIDKLSSYKKSLIYEVVTGKKEI